MDKESWCFFFLLHLSLIAAQLYEIKHNITLTAALGQNE